MTTPTFSRSTFRTSRLLEFFSEKELTMQIGHPRALWPVALVKELIDNALDAGETVGIAPDITITVESDAVTVQDNGPGLPAATLERSLDYLVRVSDKNHYVSPTRGQLGNALKCLWAAPYVADGTQGRVEVVAHGVHHTIDVTLDRIGQRPDVRHATGTNGLVKNGTLVKMHWPGIASYLDSPDPWNSDKSLPALLRNYAIWNPHAGFRLSVDTPDVAYQLGWEPADPTWSKWKPSTPTSPHWYSPERLRDLIAAYLAEERDTGRARTVREFVAEFNGLSASAKQKAVTERCGLSRARLADVTMGGDVDLARVTPLLAAMQAVSRPVPPAALGVLGEAHLTNSLEREFGVARDSVRYKRVAETDDDGCPFVLEVAFGVRGEHAWHVGRGLATGVNWSTSLTPPFRTLPFLLGQEDVDPDDPVVLLAHLAKPGALFADRGKGVLSNG